MEAFSDGAMAILITIMFLQLRQPFRARFAELRSSFPSLRAHVLSFVKNGIFWNNHHPLNTAPEVTGAILLGQSKSALLALAHPLHD